jgi:hypothetical protein
MHPQRITQPRRVARQCEHCAGPFEGFFSTIARGHGRFCSAACSRAAQLAQATARFWERVQLGPGCWLWTGRTNDDGYGLFDMGGRSSNGGRPHLAHRVAWFLEYGRWPEPDACHHCDNPPCVRHHHLFEGTNADNNRDMAQKQRNPRGVAHHNARLTAVQVREMRQRFDAGSATIADLARECGRPEMTISDAVKRVTWAHLSP